MSVQLVRAGVLTLFVVTFAVGTAAADGIGAIRGQAAVVQAKREQIEQLKIRRRAMAHRLSDTMSERFREVARLTAERDAKVAALEDEKDRTRRELAAGLFCSKCRRSKSQIERQTGKSFGAHLTEVRGEAIPMGAAEIAERMAEYDKKIERLEARLDSRIRAKDSTLRSREQSLKGGITRANIRLSDLEWALRKAQRAFDDSIRDYHDHAARSDADWHANWQLRLAQLEAQSRMRELTTDRQVERAKARLTTAIANDEGKAAADAAEDVLRGLIDARKSARQRDADAREALESGRAGDRKTRERQRATEEDEVAGLVRDTTGGWYSAVGVRTGSAWGSWAPPPSTTLTAQRDKALRRLEQIRTGSDSSTDEDDDDLVYWADRAQDSYRSMRRAAQRVRKEAREFAKRRAEIARNNLKRLGRGLDKIRDFIRGKVNLSTMRALAKLEREGWTKENLKEMATRKAMYWLAKESQKRAVQALRDAVYEKVGGDYWQNYYHTLEVDMMDPEMGIAAWFNPYKGDAIEKMFNRRIVEPFRRMMGEDDEER